jgi:hypothetical protein
LTPHRPHNPNMVWQTPNFSKTVKSSDKLDQLLNTKGHLLISKLELKLLLSFNNLLVHLTVRNQISTVPYGHYLPLNRLLYALFKNLKDAWIVLFYLDLFIAFEIYLVRY